MKFVHWNVQELTFRTRCPVKSFCIWYTAEMLGCITLMRVLKQLRQCQSLAYKDRLLPICWCAAQPHTLNYIRRVSSLEWCCFNLLALFLWIGSSCRLDFAWIFNTATTLWAEADSVVIHSKNLAAMSQKLDWRNI